MFLFSVLLSFTLSISYAEEPRSNIVWHWVDDFSSEEQRKLEEWLNRVTVATEETLGVYPFELHFYMHRREGSREPVPWASTRRHSLQGVDFHVDPSYSLQSFLEDWTAPHEISHLSIPYLGREQAWFAEGYASYMQYQIMHALGIVSREGVEEIYAQKIERVRPSFDRNQDFISVAKDLQSKNRYPDLYWGGASFFMQIDQDLITEHGQTFPKFIAEYLQCCRFDNESLEELIHTWDHLLGEAIFSELLHSYQSAPASEILK